MRICFLIFAWVLASCSVAPDPKVVTTGTEKSAVKSNDAKVIGACNTQNCQAVKLTVVAQPLVNGVLQGYVGQPVNWQFSLDAGGYAVTRNVGVYLSGTPQTWSGGIPPYAQNGTFTVVVRDLDSCQKTERDPSICSNVKSPLPAYDGSGTFNFVIVGSSVPAGYAPACSSTGSSIGSAIGGIAGLINPLFIPISIIGGIISSATKSPGC